MIPKVIHYVWLSDEKLPYVARKCIESWEKSCPGYEIKKWSLKDFDIDSIQFVKEAIKSKKWAFATDYLRLYILYNEGGIYLDSDIFAKKSFDGFIDDEFFSFIEYHHDSIHPVIQAAFLGSEKGHPFIADCLDYYNHAHFFNDDGSLNMKLAPDVYAEAAKKYGFCDEVKEQILDGMHIYGPEMVAGTPHEIAPQNVAIHMCAGSWRNFNFIQKFKKKIEFYRTVSKYGNSEE